MRGTFVRFVALVCMTDAASISDLGERVGNIFGRGRNAQQTCLSCQLSIGLFRYNLELKLLNNSSE